MTAQKSRIHIPEGFDADQAMGPGGAVFLDSTQFNALEMRRKRLGIVGFGFACAFLVMAFQLFNLTVLSHNRAKSPSVQYAMGSDGEFRRDIVDRNGQLVATNLKVTTLYADGRDILNPEEAARALLKVFPAMDFAATKTKLESDRAYIVLKTGLSPRQHASVHALGIPGFHFEGHDRRVYPKGTLASHVVGFVGPENKGLIGLEKSMDEELVDATEAGPVRLSLDLRIQYIVRDELVRAVELFKAIGAAAVVMDVKTGEILSMVSLPDFDPNEIEAASKDELFNRATLGIYEMGSTFKAFNTAMALESGKIGLEDKFDTTKPYKVSKFFIKDTHPEDYWMTTSEIFIHSSNTGSARIAHKVGVETQTEFLARLGIFDRPEIELPEIGAPMLPVQWGPTETATVSYGHGIAVSPLLVSSALSSLINGGTKVTPTLLHRAAEEDQLGERVIEEKTSRQMRRLMRDVVTEGTGGQADVPGYRVGGKTGSADKSARGGYNRKAQVTSFSAIFPSDDPEYLVLVLIDEPKGIKQTHGFRYASWNAAPTAGAIIERAAPVLGVRPSAEVSPFSVATDQAALLAQGE